LIQSTKINHKKEKDQKKLSFNINLNEILGELLFAKATQTNLEITGKQWERILAQAVGGKAINSISLGDVLLSQQGQRKNIIFEAKTAQIKELSKAKILPAIFGRINTHLHAEPATMGRELCQQWNDRVRLVEKKNHLINAYLWRGEGLNAAWVGFKKCHKLFFSHYDWIETGGDEKHRMIKAFDSMGRKRISWQYSGRQFTLFSYLDDFDSSNIIEIKNLACAIKEIKKEDVLSIALNWGSSTLEPSDTVFS